MVNGVLTVVSILSLMSSIPVKKSFAASISDFEGCRFESFRLVNREMSNVSLFKAFDVDDKFKGCYLSGDGKVEFFYLGDEDPYADVKNGYFYNSALDISATENPAKVLEQEKTYTEIANDVMPASSFEFDLPFVSSSVVSRSKSAYHMEWHLDPAPDYFQNFEESSPFYGIACGAVAAAMLTGFYDINSASLSDVVPDAVMPVMYEDNPTLAQNIIENYCDRIRLADLHTGKDYRIVNGLNTFFEDQGYSIVTTHSKVDVFSKLQYITENANACILHTENHWSLGIGYYHVRDYGEFAITHVGWKENRGNYMFAKDEVDGIIYIEEAAS